MPALLARAVPERALRRTVRPTGRERRLHPDDFILTKTDPKGRITYANDTFLEISDFRERDVLGAPHSLVRHPDMPRCIFQLLWETITAGGEIFAYVVNLCRNGDHYWVLAHVTATLDGGGACIGYHSFRRAPEPSALVAVRRLHDELLRIERAHEDRRAGLAASRARLDAIVRESGKSFNEFVLSL